LTHGTETGTRRVRSPARGEVLDAEKRIRPLLPPTPLVESPELAPRALLKLETFQPTGSFKVRGALALLTRLAPGERVVAASAGNHALGVAWAATALGVEATVVVPETAAPAKLAALERFPVELLRHGAGYDEAERHALALAGEGRRYVSAYNDPDVIAGGGTLALELPEGPPHLRSRSPMTPSAPSPTPPAATPASPSTPSSSPSSPPRPPGRRLLRPPLLPVGRGPSPDRPPLPPPRT